MTNKLTMDSLAAHAALAANGCLEWRASCQTGGYGQIRIEGKYWLAHRAMWTAVHGPIPLDLQVLHRCDNPRCVAPDHLFLGTAADNLLDATAKGRHLPGFPAWATAKRRIRKLTDDQIRAIRADSRLLRLVAADYGIAVQTVSRIRTGTRKAMVV